MGKFLNTSATNYYLEELIKNATERLILISPYLRFNDRIKELLEDKNRLKMDVRLVYGKSKLQPEEISWLNELTFLRTSFCKNLHAKCYVNEESCIITSLNLYEFSQVNNNEMGVHISRNDDSDMYEDAFKEAQRIIRISDDLNFSTENIGANQDIQSVTSEEKLSSSKIAKKHGLKTPAFLEKVSSLGYLENINGTFRLTHKGILAGGEEKNSTRFGDYFIWPSELTLQD